MPTPPRVLLLGRTNVGKSTLFNRLTRRRLAIADPSPHTTRDLQEEVISWEHTHFLLTDSGGFDVGTPDAVGAGILRQVDRALQGTSAVILVVEAQQGLRTEERTFLKTVLKKKLPIIIAVNKVDKPTARQDAEVLVAKFGFGGVPVIPVSAKNGGGTGDLLDAVAAAIRPREPQASAQPGTNPTFVFIGRTNVGKSSLVNALLRDEVRVVADSPHTTRDAAAFKLNVQQRSCTVIDTAGVRARGKTASRIEAMSLQATYDALENADVALLVWDANEPLGLVEKTLAGEVAKKGKGLILIANQWDRTKNKHARSTVALERVVQGDVPYIRWAPMVCTSATEKHNLHRILSLAFAAHDNRQQWVEADALKQILWTVKRELRPSAGKGKKRPILSKLVQVSVAPPTFHLTTTKREALPDAYRRSVEKKIRLSFPLPGTPIRVILQQPYAKRV